MLSPVANTTNLKQAHNNFMLNQKIGLAVLLAACAAGDAMAQGALNNYNTGDVLLCFRQSGAYDLVVDVGPLGTLTNLTANQRYTISAYSPSQFAPASGNNVGTNGVSWSAFTYLSDNTLFVTRPRGTNSLNLPTAAWPRSSGASQNNVALRMATIPPGAAYQLGNGLNDPASTTSAIIEEDKSKDNSNYPSGESYNEAINGSFGGEFDGYFVGNPENTTSSRFTRNGTVQRSDFFQLAPSATPASGKWLGYFEFNTNGVMTYVAYPSTPAVLSGINGNGGTNVITYSTGAYGTYSLRASSNLTVPVSSWPIIQTVANSAASFTVTNIDTADPVRFYTITAQ